MPVVYVKLEVSLHGLNSPSAEAVRQEVQDLLNIYYKPDIQTDVNVELVESAGGLT